MKNTFLFLILKAEGNSGREKDWHGPTSRHNDLVERDCIAWSVSSEYLHQAASGGGPQVHWNWDGLTTKRRQPSRTTPGDMLVSDG